MGCNGPKSSSSTLSTRSTTVTERVGAIVRRHRRVEPAGLFLWAFVLCVGLGIYLYRVNVLFTILLVIAASFFLGLLTFVIITDSQGDELVVEE